MPTATASVSEVFVSSFVVVFFFLSMILSVTTGSAIVHCWALIFFVPNCQSLYHVFSTCLYEPSSEEPYFLSKKKKPRSARRRRPTAAVWAPRDRRRRTGDTVDRSPGARTHRRGCRSCARTARTHRDATREKPHPQKSERREREGVARRGQLSRRATRASSGPPLRSAGPGTT